MTAESSDTVFLSFFCSVCNQEIEAPAEMAGRACECPACEAPITVPATSEPGTLWGSQTLSPSGPTQTQRDAMKSRTIRIELPESW